MLLGPARAALTFDRYGHLLSDDLAVVASAFGNAVVSTAVGGGRVHGMGDNIRS
ncbi:hypothetical protein [Mycobacterium spongiae]|uniref:Uncharacterized protein n=1 Tax=Mycobacterium spongiae TaxID=886343 RepID=A0A975PXT4_9MYCO|nr:hypothetical protein [Mycobacterium spongiae]QUR68159.1 hypothetical protein F6B93_14670 [Mycobacterium spongiae]